MAWSKLSQTEIALAKKWYVENGEPVAAIAKRLGRDFSTMSRLLAQRKKRKADGRPQMLSIGKVDKLEEKLEVSCLPIDGMGTMALGARTSLNTRCARILVFAHQEPRRPCHSAVGNHRPWLAKPTPSMKSQSVS